MKITPNELKTLLVGANLLSEQDFAAAEQKTKAKNIPLEEFLVKNGLVSGEHLGQVIASYLKINFINLSDEKINHETLTLIPETVARAQATIAFRQDNKNVHIGTANPDNYEFIKLLETKTGKTVKIHYATPDAILEALNLYKSSLDEKIKNIVEDVKINPGDEDNIVKLVNALLEYAYQSRASDIHIEPLENEITVRFRIDGVLHEVTSYPKSLHDKVVFRVKIMSKLRTDEHAAPQDGRIDFKIQNASFDVRISILPVTNGENIVLRLLSERSRKLSLEDLGLIDKDLEKTQKAAQRPYGMILSAGPTGSGKTTTLYAILQILNHPDVNIMTIEDPVEYEMEHVQQAQVNPKKNLNFANGLRYIVRQDPDIIMVGEIRDQETADIAVNAAMTGHLLLSTLHSNDAATVFPRLAEMKIEPFLIASSVNLVVAQRLVRKICERCRKSCLPNEQELTMIKASPRLAKIIHQLSGKKTISNIRIYKGVGCDLCGHTGYFGRTGIFEVMEITDELRALVTAKSSADIIDKKAKEQGMTPMLYDGIKKVLQGTTSLQEVITATET